MPEIEIGKPRHLETDLAHKRVMEWFKGIDARINDQTAVTIASWWQEPSGHGLAFAGLCQSGRVDKRQDLIDACLYELAEFRRPDENEEDVRALMALKDWAYTYK